MIGPLVNSSLVERDLLWTTKDIFVSIITYEIPRILGALWQELDKGQVYISYSNMYFLNHDITTSHPSPGSLALLLMTQFSYCLYSWSLLCSYSLCFLHALFYWWLNMHYTKYLFPYLLLPPSWASWPYRPLAHLVNITKFGKPWEVDCWINEWTHACYFLYTYEIANISHIQYCIRWLILKGLLYQVKIMSIQKRITFYSFFFPHIIHLYQEIHVARNMSKITYFSEY